MTGLDSERKANWLGELCRWHGWVPLGITVAILAVGLSLMRAGPDAEPDFAPLPGSRPVADGDTISVRRLPSRVAVTDATAMHSVVVAEEEGRTVFRIRAVAGGDEVIVDTATGKLITVREWVPRIPLPPTVSRVTAY